VLELRALRHSSASISCPERSPCSRCRAAGLHSRGTRGRRCKKYVSSASIVPAEALECSGLHMGGFGVRPATFIRRGMRCRGMRGAGNGLWGARFDRVRLQPDPNGGCYCGGQQWQGIFPEVDVHVSGAFGRSQFLDINGPSSSGQGCVLREHRSARTASLLWWIVSARALLLLICGARSGAGSCTQATYCRGTRRLLTRSTAKKAEPEPSSVVILPVQRCDDMRSALGRAPIMADSSARRGAANYASTAPRKND
jgi:hypothetical protein